MRSNLSPPPSLPKIVAEHCTVHFEEQLYAPALSLLLSSSSARNAQCPVGPFPPAQYLALAATLSLHPRMTTRTNSTDRHDAARSAQLLSQTIIHTLGAKRDFKALREAFRFTKNVGRDRRASARRSISANTSKSSHAPIQHAYANEQSVWHNADDFWAAVGWAFNCSILHRERWQYWKPWLETVIDVLGADEISNSGDPETLLAQYLLSSSGGRLSKSRIMRAIFADGSIRSTSEFGEVWRNETEKISTEKRRGEERKQLNIERDNYGDYGDDASDESDVSISAQSLHPSYTAGAKPSRRHSHQAPALQSVFPTNSAGKLGGEESVTLRQELLSLLVTSCRSEHSLYDIVELLDVMAEFIRPLPLDDFQPFILPTRPFLEDADHNSLCDMIARSLSTNHSTNGKQLGSISPSDFTHRIAASSASSTSVVDNAKLGLIVECFLRSLWRRDALDLDSSKLVIAVERGVRARQDKASQGSDKITTASSNALTVMKACTERLTVLLSLLNLSET